MKTRIIVTLLLLWFINGVVLTQDFNEMVKIVASDRAANDWFGYSVSISGNYAIIGAVGEQLYSGSAYIFERDGSGNWNQVQKIVASDRAIEDYFGYSVSISGNYAIVAAYGEDGDALGGNYQEQAGSAYVFERDGSGNWNQVQKIVASDRTAYDWFGWSLSISGNYAIVGAHYEDEDASGGNTVDAAGSAYIFERDVSGTWNQVQKIVASDRAADDYFGWSASITGIYAIVGANYEDEDASGENTMNSAGSAYIFERQGSGNWNQVQKIVASDREAYDLFGKAVSITGNNVIVGAYHENEDASGENTMNSAGSAYIFERDGSGTWNEVQKIVASDRAANDFFGTSVSISGNFTIIGAYREDEDASGGNYQEEAGSAYIFKRDGSGSWNQVQKIVASDRTSYDWFGWSLSISGNYAIVGAIEEDDDASGGNYLEDAGSAYIFESCTPGTDPDPDNIIENGNFETCILSPWSLWVADYLGVTANAVLLDGTCTVSGITLSASPEYWQVQFSQYFTTAQLSMLEKDSTYVLEFDAFAEADNRHCRITIDQNEEPWIALLDENILIGTETASYSFEFIVDSVFSVMKLSFQLGLEASPVTFDNVRLVKKVGGSPSAIDRQEKNSVQLFPNPALEYLTVIAENGAIVTLFNTMGSPVKTGIPVNNRVSFKVGSLPEGIYIVGISNGKNVSISKVVIQ